MHGMHARLPKNFVLEERLERYADVIELEPCRLAGHWAEACWPLDAKSDRRAFDEVRLDLGCGKGSFVVEAARRAPHTLYVAMDCEPLCIAYTAQHVMEAGLRNVVVVPGKGSLVAEAFCPGELRCIHLNFPTPFPRKREAHKRLVILERLLDFREALLAKEEAGTGCLAGADGAGGADGSVGTLRLRTDSQPLRDFTRGQLELAGYDVIWQSDNERAERPGEPTSEYEERLVASGATVYGLWATPGKLPKKIEQTAPLSLVDYLPDDLFESGNGYVPHGMQGTIINLRNRRLHGNG